MPPFEGRGAPRPLHQGAEGKGRGGEGGGAGRAAAAAAAGAAGSRPVLLSRNMQMRRGGKPMRRSPVAAQAR